MRGAMISTAQMRMMYSLAKKNGRDDVKLHRLVKAVSTKDSIKQLTMGEAKKVIDVLLYEGGQTKPNIPDRATENQRRMILDMARQLGLLNDMKRFRRFLEAKFGVPDIAFLTIPKASAVIEALKAMEKRGWQSYGS